MLDAPPRRRINRYVIWGILAALAALWIYAFFLAPSGHPDKLDDPTFSDAAEPICQDANARAAELPQASQATDPADRADQIVASNEVYLAMLDQLEALPRGTGRDAEILTAWLADYRTFLGDRARYAETLRTDGDARLLVTEKANGQITEPVDSLAKVNHMPACATPADV